MKMTTNHASKIEVIKKAILIRSGFLSEFGSNVSIEVGNFDFAINTPDQKIYELMLIITINGVIYCSDCMHNPNEISNTIEEYIKKVYRASQFFLDDKDLSIKRGNSLRGVLVDGFKFGFDEITNLSISVYYDPGDNF